jgi:signal transduction histidine kinase
VEKRFRRQLFGGLAALVALIITMAIVAIVVLRSTSHKEATVAEDYAEGFSHTQQLHYSEDALVAAARGYLLSSDPRLHERFVRDKADFEQRLTDLEHYHLALSVRLQLADVVAVARDYLSEISRAVEARATTDPARLAAMFEERLRPRRDALMAAMDELAHAERAVFNGALREARRAADLAQAVVLAASLLAIACGLVMAALVGRRLTRQFHELEAATAAATRAAKARDDVLAVVSHDLRNPLSAIHMAADLVRETTAEQITRKQVGTIHNAAERMRRMIEELLETSQLDSGQIELHAEPLDAAEVLDAAGDLFRARAAESGIELQCRGPHVRVVADRERVIEVLSNLIGNALKFTPRGGHVAVAAEPQGGDVRFTVVDDGKGLESDQVERVFERGWQADRSHKRGGGLGLGLYICRRLVEAHRGAIGVSSEVGHGARFWFTLPAATA